MPARGRRVGQVRFRKLAPVAEEEPEEA